MGYESLNTPDEYLKIDTKHMESLPCVGWKIT